MAFTEQELALIAKWVTGYPLQLSQLQQSLVFAQGLYAETLLEKGIYQKMQADALDALDALLIAKKDAIELADPEFERTVEYLGGHPQNAGTDVTAWRITHVDELLETIVDYSHSVNWDNNAAIQAAEGTWWVFWTWQADTFYGTDTRLNGLDGAIDGTTLNISALTLRYQEFV